MLAERKVAAMADEQTLAPINQNRNANANSARPWRENRDRTSTYRISFRLRPRRRNPDTDVRISSAKTIRTHSALRNNNAIMTASNIGSSRPWFLFFEDSAVARELVQRLPAKKEHRGKQPSAN